MNRLDWGMVCIGAGLGLFFIGLLEMAITAIGVGVWMMLRG